MTDEIYQFRNLVTYPKILHGISTSAFGSIKKEDGEINYDHLKKFRKQLEIPERVIAMSQIHSGNVVTIHDTNTLRIADTDGLVTNLKQVSLMVLTADCLPILFYDPKQEVIGLAHAGYRGLLNHIIQNTVERMSAEFKSNPKDILVGIGPGIRTLCYEVGEEVIAMFEQTYPELKNIFVQQDGRIFLNLRETALQCLLSAGIQKNHIELSKSCTRCDDQFYSYRRGDTNERFGSIICML